VPLYDRVWREETTTWWVDEGYDLSWIFANWEAEVEKVKRQMVLPGFD